MKRQRITSVPDTIKKESRGVPTSFVPQPEPIAPPKRIGMLVSRLPQSVEIAYNGMSIKLAPRGRSKKDIDYDKLGTLPKGVQFIG